MDPQALFTRLRALAASFTTGQLVSLVVTFVLVVGVVAGSAWWLSVPNYSLLFAEMDPEAAADIVTRLKNLKVDYQLDEGGRAIRVPSTQVDELRLQLTSQGMPASGRIGFEIFDRTAFGATEFLEKVNYRRALEGEIARTIATISEVASARVHIAIGKDTLFGEPRPSKASVVLRLRDNRGLGAGTISGIANLVAASVEGLRPEAVVIVDSQGRPLARPSDDASDPAGAAQVERQQRLERDLVTRVTALLEPVVGEGRVRVNAAIVLDPQSREQTEERWDPNTVVRSRQTTADASSSAAAAGIAGARANMPTPPAAPGSAPGATASATPPVSLPAGAGSSRTSEITNYEVSRTTSRIVKPSGDVARLSVAVIIDDGHGEKKQEDGTTTATRTPRTQEELQKLHGLVAAAVGLNTERGDQLTVENIAFDEPQLPEPEAPTFMTRYGTWVKDGLRIGVILILGLTAMFVVIRPLMNRTSPRLAGALVGGAGAITAPTLDRPKTVAELESEIEAQLEAAAAEKGPESRRLPVLTRRVSTLASKEPEQTAKLLRTWLTEQER